MKAVLSSSHLISLISLKRTYLANKYVHVYGIRIRYSRLLKPSHRIQYSLLLVHSGLKKPKLRLNCAKKLEISRKNGGQSILLRETVEKLCAIPRAITNSR